MAAHAPREAVPAALAAQIARDPWAGFSDVTVGTVAGVTVPAEHGVAHRVDR